MRPREEPAATRPAGPAAAMGSLGVVEAGRPRYLLERMAWLMRLRWMAVAGVVLVAIVGAAVGAVPGPMRLLAVALGIALFNLWAWSRWRTLSARPTGAPLAQKIFWQLVGDIVALTLLLHFSGGAENPFAMFFAFHMAIAAMLLPQRYSVYLASTAAVLHGGSVLGEFVGVLDHYSLVTAASALHGPEQAVRLWSAPTYVLGYILAFSLMLFGTTYFVQSVVERHRHLDALRREHERVAVSRDRLARVGQLAAGVAHAVRNPLHGLISSMDLLATRKTDPAEAETLGLMGEACTRIATVTERLLALTRDAPLRKSTQDLARLVEEAVRLASPGARGRTARIRIELDATGAVEVDADRLTEALINVIDNAVDACGSGDLVTVRTTDEAEGSGNVCIEVDDTGAGIPAEDLGRVFDPFFTTKPIGEGTGLGLALTRQIVEEHGGEVSIDSAAGRGTRVRLSIPRGETPEGAQT